MREKSEIILYTSNDGKIKIDVRVENETVWLTQLEMAELFNKNVRTVNEHVLNIFKENELDKNSVIRNFRTTAKDGKSYQTNSYNLDVIISVGYRIKSNCGTQFRIWATQRLREYIVKGFTMNDDLLKQAGDGKYFDQLLQRIRDIRSSEKVFWRKVLDIYSTSVDYDPNLEITKKFFKTIQNKMHWAAHQHTAAEIIMLRADYTQPFMGLTSFSGKHPRRDEVTVAKNYLNVDELDTLNLIVSSYLDFAELQAKRHKPMKMAGWITKLDGFLKLTEHKILNNTGKISNEKATQKALEEYDKYKGKIDDELSEVEKHFVAEIEKAKKLIENNPIQKRKENGKIRH